MLVYAGEIVMSPLLHTEYSVLLLKCYTPRFSVLGYTPNSEIYIPSHSKLPWSRFVTQLGFVTTRFVN